MPGFDLRGLGWTPELAENIEPGLVPGRVAAAHRAAFDVWTEDGAVRSRLPGRALHDGLDGAVGDWVGLSDGLIRAVLPRRSAIVRNAAGLTTTAQTLAANVDVAFVVSSLGPSRIFDLAHAAAIDTADGPFRITSLGPSVPLALLSSSQARDAARRGNDKVLSTFPPGGPLSRRSSAALPGSFFLLLS